MSEVWKSPRKLKEEADKIEEDIRRYAHDVFERVMAKVDSEEITHEVAMGMLAIAYEVGIDE